MVRGAFSIPIQPIRANQSLCPLDHNKTLADFGKIPPNIFSLRCLGGAAVRRRTSDLEVVGSIPGPGVIRHLGQLSLPSLRGRQIEWGD